MESRPPGAPTCRLMAWSPDDWVRVVQHSPVTVIQIDQTELALENTLASEIEVEIIRKGEDHEDRQ